MSDFVINQATLDDTRTLSQIGAATFLESFVEVIVGDAIINHCETQHSIDVYEKYLSAPRGRAWIVRHAATGAPIGYALNCEPELDEVESQPGDIELKRIYTLSRFHGTGTGAALMEASIAHAHDIGASRLLLEAY